MPKILFGDDKGRLDITDDRVDYAIAIGLHDAGAKIVFCNKGISSF